MTLVENVTVEQLGGSPPGSQTFHQSPAPSFWTTPQYTYPSASKSPSPRETSTPIGNDSVQTVPARRRMIPPVGGEYFMAALVHSDGWCNFINSKGVRCTPKIKMIVKHYLNCHALRELLQLHKKTLKLEDCVTLKSAEMVKIAEEYCLRCPINGCGHEFADLSSFKRHMKTNIAPHGGTRSKGAVEVIIDNDVVPRRNHPSNNFNSGEYEAVWRLLEARKRI
ncbi:hypothetical protein K439DRAFT_419477 [Ramaria rubella]|nr:hypothetical protein K439DRAFT_419477 [Ramaria rubella]